MRKLSILLSVFLIAMNYRVNAQIEAGGGTPMNIQPYEQESLDKFRNTETVFVLPETLDQAVYQEILEEIWTITPYQLVSYKELGEEYLLNDKYSFVALDFVTEEQSSYDRTDSREVANNSVRAARTRSVNMTSYFPVIRFFTMDTENVTEKKEGFSEKKWKRKKLEVLRENMKSLVNIYLTPDYNTARKCFATGEKDEEFVQELVAFGHTDAVFSNLKPGYIKNYLQKAQNLIKVGETYSSDEKQVDEQIHALAGQTLYIPSSTESSEMPKRRKKSQMTLEEWMEEYAYEHEVIDYQKLSEKIMKGEPLYYMTMTGFGRRMFITITNGATGDIVYFRPVELSMLKPNVLKPEYVKEISQAVEEYNN